MNPITVQIRKRKYPYGRKYDPNEDKLIGEFTTLKEALKLYKTMGCGTVTHYFTVTENGIPPIIITPATRHFKAVGLPRATKGPIEELLQ